MLEILREIVLKTYLLYGLRAYKLLSVFSREVWSALKAANKMWSQPEKGRETFGKDVIVSH